jgi:CO/xanthine dehydrogenase FAD-binding subunit
MANGIVMGTWLVFGVVVPLLYRVKTAEDFLVGKTLTAQTASGAAELALDKACVMGKDKYKLAAMASTLKGALLHAAQ